MRCVWLIGIVVACDGIAVPPYTSTTVTGAVVDVVPVEQAIGDIARRRCARQLTCARVGSGRVWPTFEACSKDIQAATHDYLLGSPCNEGIHAARLASCLAETEEQSCNEATSVVVKSCRDDALCR